MKSYLEILFIVIFTITCAGTLFLVSSAFVETEISPKYYSAVFGGLIFGLIVTALSFKIRIADLFCDNNRLIRAIILIICAQCSIQAVYGILQFFGFFYSNNSFRVTGSFDNPAGFAACLCAGLPASFYLQLKNHPLQNWTMATTNLIIIVAILLSGSRAGMASMLAVYAVIFFFRFPKYRKIYIISFPVLLLAFSGSYLLKKDSADGRLLIWQCSANMIADKPVLGHGLDGFNANYMNYQAMYFQQHPDSKFTMLADNVSHPFNEYFLLLVNFGITGFIIFLIACSLLWKSFLRCNHEPVACMSACCLLSIAVFALFSYPLRYPFVWLMIVLSTAIIIYKADYPIKLTSAIAYPAKLLIIAVIAFSGIAMYQRMINEIYWCNIAHESLSGKTEQILPEYYRLYNVFKTNDLFLYNYAAELNVVKRYEESLHIAHECEKKWADYDLQMLIADNYENMKQFEQAEAHYKKASLMCPVRFMPLYKLAIMYEHEGRDSEALKYANAILYKKIKVPSSVILAIKNEIRELINRVKEKQKIMEKRQDNVSKKFSFEAVLPP